MGALRGKGPSHAYVTVRHSLSRSATTMSLVTGYSSSDDDEGPSSYAQDAFGLSKLPTAKKIRVDEPPSSSVALTAAPDVLAEVRTNSHILSRRIPFLMHVFRTH